MFWKGCFHFRAGARRCQRSALPPDQLKCLACVAWLHRQLAPRAFRIATRNPIRNTPPPKAVPIGLRASIKFPAFSRLTRHGALRRTPTLAGPLHWSLVRTGGESFCAGTRSNRKPETLPAPSSSARQERLALCGENGIRRKTITGPNGASGTSGFSRSFSLSY